MRDECEHGSLRRCCEICERDETIRDLESRLAECVGALRTIVDAQPKRAELPCHPSDCPECKRWENHPIQRGICDARWREIHRRERDDERAERLIQYRLKDIARAAIEKSAAVKGEA